MTPDEWTIANLQELQNAHRTDHPVQQNLITMPARTPTKALSMRIQERFDRYTRNLKDKYTSKRMIWKIARAVEERRIEEERIEAIWDRLDNVANRGAYFGAVAKGAFKAVGLSWIEEEWQDA